MANSYKEYTTGLTGTSFSDFNVKHISQGHLKVLTSTNNGTSYTSTSLTVAVSGTTATLSGAPSTGSDSINKIRIYRDTGTDQLVDFQNGSRLSESDLDTAYQQGLYAAQEVIENAPFTGYPATGAQGAQGIQGVAGTDGVSPTTALSTSFESSEQTITNAAFSVSVAHSLGGVPKLCQAVLRCKTAQGNYSVNDEFHLTNDILVQNATNVTFCSDAALNVKNKTDYTLFTPTVANWKLVLRAFV